MANQEQVHEACLMVKIFETYRDISGEVVMDVQHLYWRFTGKVDFIQILFVAETIHRIG